MRVGGKEKYLFAVLVMSFFSRTLFSDEFTLEELDILRRTNRISIEDYEILKSELTGYAEDGESIYTLIINGNIKFNMFKFIKKDGEDYFPLFSFFQMLEFKNYEFLNNKITMKLGRDLENVEIDLDRGRIKIERTGEEIQFNPQEIIKKNSEIYLQSGIFAKIFLDGIDRDEKKHTLRMNLNFNTPREIEYYLRNNLNRSLSSEEGESILFTNKKMLFDLGYTRVNLKQELNRDEKEKSFKKDWEGELGYKGNLLYGEFTTSYDLKNEIFGSSYIYYPEIWKEHSLELGSYGDKNREWGMNFRKEKGYYLSGKEIVIREIVPMGSRAELLHMGFPIEIQTEEDGAVEFRSSEIKADRKYSIKIYTPDGKIYTVDVDTSVDFRLQNRGQLEYNLDIREDYSSKKYSSQGNLYYGLTNNLTLGLGAERIPEKKEENTQYLHDLNLDFIYSDSVKKMPYTLALGNNYTEKGKYKNSLEGQIDLKNLRLRTEQTKYSSYYKERDERSYTAEYNPGGGYSLDYNYYTQSYSDSERKTNYSVGLSLHRSPMRDLLMTTEYRKRGDSSDEYSLNMYYTGFHLVNTRLNNRWSNDGKDYEANLTLMNKNLWERANFSLEMGYHSREEVRFTLKFDLNYNNWLTAGFNLNDKGRQEYSVGLDRVVDLKDITKNIESMDTSRVKVITFVDSNNNNVFDPGEETLENVDVKIGSQNETTDEKGEAYFHGVPNGILYDLKPVVKRPGYTMGKEKITLRGNKTGTIEANIPVKPLASISGMVVYDENLIFSREDMSEIYENTLIKVKDKEGNIVELSVPDENGMFDVSGLFPEDYEVEIIYMGKSHEIPKFNETIKVSYFNRDRKIAFNIGAKSVALKEKN
ncbi:MAG: hypothetical protein ACRCR2_04725 [Fusobacteriaceae bacterium]